MLALIYRTGVDSIISKRIDPIRELPEGIEISNEEAVHLTNSAVFSGKTKP